MPKIDVDAAPERNGTRYPPPFDAPCKNRRRRKLGDAVGLTQFGVNRLVLPPGQWSSQRHWHTREDEFVVVLEGEVVLVENEGETVLCAGDCAGFPAGAPNGHHLVNRSGRDAVVLEVGGRRPDEDHVDYPDIDMTYTGGDDGYRRRDGALYPGQGRAT